jgi:hypothetical protein
MHGHYHLQSKSMTTPKLPSHMTCMNPKGMHHNCQGMIASASLSPPSIVHPAIMSSSEHSRNIHPTPCPRRAQRSSSMCRCTKLPPKVKNHCTTNALKLSNVLDRAAIYRCCCPKCYSVVHQDIPTCSTMGLHTVSSN